MAFETTRFSRVPTIARGAFTAVILAAAFAVPAVAQQPAPAQGGAKKEDQGSAWVKLCEKQKLKKDPKDQNPTEVDVCLTHHERFHPNTGQPLISAAIRELGAPDKRTVMIMVPLGRLLPAGLVMKVDDKDGVKIPYAYCTQLGCVAEMPAKDDLVAQFKQGKELLIGTVDVARKRIAFKVPLNGFTRALDGKPIDRKVYAAARKEMFEAIRKRRDALIKKAKEEAAQKAGQAGQKKQ